MVVFSQKSSKQPELVKENKVLRAPLSSLWVLAALAASAATLAAVARIDHALPAPLGPDALPARFHALTAHRHLVNLTALGPRVAGSYENEVLAVGVLVSALRHIAAHASPHNRIELDVHTASGAFPLAFMDGMNNVYRGVQSVVARVRGAGGKARARSALLFNCHFDSVPDSPGASDDGAGCAVLLESMRALAAGGPLRHDAVFLFNGAEENIMQASHAFITQHKWAKDVRAFINIEACGAGGREVLFQAGPHDPWIVEMYAGVVPHPFASSLAQELFESGIIPADTDFRIFRDFGKLSGLDLAWSANGYVYHTRLDTPDRVPPAALQRTGDNVLALAQGLLASESLESEPDASSRQPVFFDVLGLGVVSVRAPAALLLAAGAAALALLKVHVSAGQARRALCVPRGAWWRAVGRAGAAGAAAHGAGLLAAVAPALLLHESGARLCFYSRGALLAPLYALPALAGTWAAAAWVWGTPALMRGWWAARAWHDAAALCWAALLLLCALRGLRSGFLPLLWALLPAGADLLAAQARAGPGPRAALWALGAALPAAQTWYLALGSLHMFVPMMGRAGAGAVPADVCMAALVAVLVQASCGWVLPLVLAARGVRRLAGAAGALCGLALVLVLVTPLGAPYSAERPQRLMVFHTRRTLHAPLEPTDRVDHFYWVPELDANTPHSVDKYVPEMRAARPVSAGECVRLLYCGAPYYLPVLTLVARSHAAPAPAAPLPRLRARLEVARHNATALELTVQLRGPPHCVLVLAPVRGVRLAWSSALAAPQEGAAWGARRTYFVALHDARAGEDAEGAEWHVSLLLTHAAGLVAPHWADVSLAGHALFGRQARAPQHDALLRALPPWVAATGWGVDLHLYRV